MKTVLQIITLLAIFVLPAFLLLFPRSVRKRPWRASLQAWAIVQFGILVPLAVFCLSANFQPAWKGACHHGWLDCFHEGKMVLLPIVLWAMVSLYTLDVLRLERTTSWGWVRWGLLNGAVVSTVCLLHGLTIADSKDEMQSWWAFMLPVYTAVWYIHRAWKTWQGVPRAEEQAGFALLSSLPFWIGSVLTSQRLYRELPDVHPNNCFVVTAASHGHPWLVGTRQVEGGGHLRRTNKQLQVFRLFESLWQQRAPTTHALFRRVYNVWGYRTARLIRSPWQADVAYLLLKPSEWLTAVVLYGEPMANESVNKLRNIRTLFARTQGCGL